MKFSSIKNSIKMTKSTPVFSDNDKPANINNSINESAMSPELLEAYLNEKINMMQSEIDEARTMISKCEQAIAFDDRAANSLSSKMELISKFERKPSKQALRQMDFLKDYIPKLRERNARLLKKYQHNLQSAQALFEQEIISCKQKLSHINHHEFKN